MKKVYEQTLQTYRDIIAENSAYEKIAQCAEDAEKILADNKKKIELLLETAIEKGVGIPQTEPLENEELDEDIKAWFEEALDQACGDDEDIISLIYDFITYLTDEDDQEHLISLWYEVKNGDKDLTFRNAYRFLNDAFDILQDSKQNDDNHVANINRKCCLVSIAMNMHDDIREDGIAGYPIEDDLELHRFASYYALLKNADNMSEEEFERAFSDCQKQMDSSKIKIALAQVYFNQISRLMKQNPKYIPDAKKTEELFPYVMLTEATQKRSGSSILQGIFTQEVGDVEDVQDYIGILTTYIQENKLDRNVYSRLASRDIALPWTAKLSLENSNKVILDYFSDYIKRGRSNVWQYDGRLYDSLIEAIIESIGITPLSYEKRRKSIIRRLNSKRFSESEIMFDLMSMLIYLENQEKVYEDDTYSQMLYNASKTWKQDFYSRKIEEDTIGEFTKLFQIPADKLIDSINKSSVEKTNEDQSKLY